jgi:hypothetical protein
LILPLRKSSAQSVLLHTAFAFSVFLKSLSAQASIAMGRLPRNMLAAPEMHERLLCATKSM